MVEYAQKIRPHGRFHPFLRLNVCGGKTCFPMEEKELVRLAQEGSEEAFSTLVRSYQAKVYSMALNFTRNREVADDLAQDIFLKAYLALPKFRFKSEFGTWLYRISINHVRDFLRKQKRAKEIPMDSVSPAVLAGPDTIKEMEEGREVEEQKRLARDIVQTLPPKYQIVVTLRDIQGLSYERITKLLKLSPGTVDSRLHRARKMLRKKLALQLSREGGNHEMQVC